MAGSKVVTRSTKSANAARGNFRQRQARGRHANNGSCPTAFDTFSGQAAVAEDVHANVTGIQGTPALIEMIASQKTQDPSDCSPIVEFLASLGNPIALLDSPGHCSEIIEKLEGGDENEKHVVLLWLQTALRQLALSKSGCHVVQKTIEVAKGSDRDMIINELKDHIIELYESPHGNHVLSKAVQVLPAASNSFITSALQHRASAVSKHRYGCRVVCRLLEHCDEEIIGGLLDEVLSEAAALARHAYGNFVVQSMLEHSSPSRRSALLSCLLPEFGALAMHRAGSLVAQRALDYCGAEGQGLAIRALLQADDATSVVEVACSRYGSYVIEQVASLRHTQGGAQDVAHVLAENLQRLRASEHAERTLVAFGLAASEPVTSVP